MKRLKDSKLLRAALWYREKMGFSVIPQRSNKKPYFSWERYQTEPPTVAEIRQWWSEWPDANIAIVTGKASGLTVIDVDDKAGLEILESILPEGFKCPKARSPHGGRHFYMQYNPALVTRSRDLEGIDTKNDGGCITAPPSVGANGVAYEWVEAFHLRTTPLPEVPRAYISAVTAGKPAQRQIPILGVEELEINFKKGFRDQTLFHVAYSLIKGGMQPENVEKVLINLSATCVPPFTKQEAIIKARSAAERAFKKDRVLSRDIKEWVSVTQGVFSVTDIYNALHLVTPEDKANARQVLRRLKEGGFIESYGLRADVYRRVNQELIVMDYKNAEVKPLPIDWPLDIGEFFQTYAKNICMVAGTKDSGKTCFLLDFIKRNMDKYEIHYFNSEMSSEELSMRLRKHEDISISDWKFDAYEHTDNFHDVIRPDCINVIDYLEINKDFSEIGDKIKAIHEKLGKGIAVIGIQKDYGATFGRGKAFSLQRPRLYVTLDQGWARVIVAKNRKHAEDNPVGNVLRYKIVGGWNLIPSGYWRPEEKDETKEGRLFK